MAVAIIAVISIVSVQTLYDGVAIRAKQYSLETSSESSRIFLKKITKAIIEAGNISVSADNHEIEIVDENMCRMYVFDSANKRILYSETMGQICTPPVAGSKGIMDDEIEITKLTFSPAGESVTFIDLEIDGIFKDSLGNHPIRYKTSITPRM